MRPMKLSDVEGFTGRRGMGYDEAIKISNPGFGCAQQAVALSLLTRLNTPQDWLRLQACLVILRHQRQEKRKWRR